VIQDDIVVTCNSSISSTALEKKNPYPCPVLPATVLSLLSRESTLICPQVLYLEQYSTKFQYIVIHSFLFSHRVTYVCSLAREREVWRGDMRAATSLAGIYVFTYLPYEYTVLALERQRKKGKECCALVRM
jgi:hypothetical protein